MSESIQKQLQLIELEKIMFKFPPMRGIPLEGIQYLAKTIYNQGYRKQDVLAKELLEEVNKILKESNQISGYFFDGSPIYEINAGYVYDSLEKLFKRYTEAINE